MRCAFICHESVNLEIKKLNKPFLHCTRLNSALYKYMPDTCQKNSMPQNCQSTGDYTRFPPERMNDLQCATFCSFAYIFDCLQR